jgi:ribosomal-protein-alanine N-acetyltransferase
MADVIAIAGLESRSFHRPGERFDQRRVQHLISHPRFVIDVAERNGTVVGWVAGFVWLRGVVPWGRIYAIAVDPQAQGQKLGRRLMEKMIALLESQGATRVFLEVRPDNQAALRLYHRLGFVECRSLPNYYGDGSPALRMVRLTASSPAASP